MSRFAGDLEIPHDGIDGHPIGGVRDVQQAQVGVS